MTRTCFVLVLGLVYQASALRPCRETILNKISENPVKNVLETIFKYWSIPVKYITRGAPEPEISDAIKCKSVTLWQLKSDEAFATKKSKLVEPEDYIVNRYFQTETDNGLIYERDLNSNVTYTISVAMLTTSVLGFYRCADEGEDNFDSGYCVSAYDSQSEYDIKQCVSKMKSVGISTIKAIPWCTM